MPRRYRLRAPVFRERFTAYHDEPHVPVTASAPGGIALEERGCMSIAVATDLSGADRAAFVHAAALARAAHTRLVAIHAGSPRPMYDVSWATPEVQDVDCCDDPADSVVVALREIGPELVVLGTTGRHGFAGWFHGSVAEAIARNTAVAALFVPHHARGFVDATDGALRLRRVLVPSATAAEARRGIEGARALLALAGVAVPIELVHVGAIDPELASLGVTRIDDIERAFAGDDLAGCVVAMPTRGHDGIAKILRGSQTERVIREAACPVLSIPV